MGQVQTENKRLLTDKEEWDAFEKAMRAGAKEDKIKKRDFNDYCLALSEDPNFWGVVQRVKVAQDAKTLTLVVADTLRKVGEVLSAIGYYEKPEDFLSEHEEYQKAEILATKNLIQ